jgi:hypothetical protein
MIRIRVAVARHAELHTRDKAAREGWAKAWPSPLRLKWLPNLRDVSARAGGEGDQQVFIDHRRL